MNSILTSEFNAPRVYVQSWAPEVISYAEHIYRIFNLSEAFIYVDMDLEYDDNSRCISFFLQTEKEDIYLSWSPQVVHAAMRDSYSVLVEPIGEGEKVIQKDFLTCSSTLNFIFDSIEKKI